MRTIMEPKSTLEVFEAALLREWEACIYFHDLARRMAGWEFAGPMDQLVRKHAALRDELEGRLMEMRAVWKIDKDINDSFG
ncbi:MAG: hypothetical protein ACE5H0_00695 [Bacteroidota bacterium]